MLWALRHCVVFYRCCCVDHQWCICMGCNGWCSNSKGVRLLSDLCDILSVPLVFASTGYWKDPHLTIIMVALCNRADRYIFILFLSSSSFFFFLAYSQRSEIGCSPYFGTWCGLNANLECSSEMRCTRLAANTGRKKSPSRHHRTTLLAISSQLRHVSTIGKKTC